MRNSPPDATDLPADGRIQSLALKVDGRHMHCLQAGSGPAVILLHGGASDSRDWIGTLEALSHSYTLYAPDILGYGQSDRSKSGYSLSNFVDSTEGFIQELGHSSQVLVGHSLGGRICLEIAFRRPDLVRGLVLIDTVGFGKLARWGKSLGAMIWGARKLLGITQPYPKFLIEGDEDQDWICLNRLPSLKVPTLIVWNERDPYYPLSGALKAKELMANARLEIFPGYGHAPHKQRRAEFNDLLLGFLNHD